MVKLQIQLDRHDYLRVENYWHRNKLHSRTDGIRSLLRAALNAAEAENTITGAEDSEEPGEQWRVQVADYVDGKREVTIPEVARDGLGIINPNHTEVIMVARALKGLGYYRFQRRTEDGRQWAYRSLFSGDENKDSPWGEIQTTSVVAPGITRVTTAAHGGLRVNEELLAAMPEYMRYHDNGWFEEDCEWAFVFAVFEGEIRKHGSARDVKRLDSGIHLEILAREWPEEYKQWRSENAT